MSKSRGNTVTPDEYINKYGSDVFRMYLAFGFAYIEGGPWSDDGIKAIDRFIGRINRVIEEVIAERGKSSSKNMGADEKELNFVRHNTIKSVTQDTDQFQFNTAIARLMELVNAIYKYDMKTDKNYDLMEETLKDLLKLLSPFAPHFTEEMWESMGEKYSIFNQNWPVYDEKALVKDEVEIAVQFNGQIRFRTNVPTDSDNKEIEDIECPRSAHLEEYSQDNCCKGRLVNIVIK